MRGLNVPLRRRMGSRQHPPIGPKANKDRWGSRGFLLVEALATLAISALVLVGLISILSVMLRAGDRIATRNETLETTGRAVAALEREFRIIGRARWAGTARGNFVFEGFPYTVHFARDVLQENGLVATRVVAVQSVATERGSRLLWVEGPLTPGATSLADVSLDPAEELYKGQFIFRFEYAGRLKSTDPESFFASWPSVTRLPSAIRIILTDALTRASMGSLRVPLLIDAEPGCAAPEHAFCSLVDRNGGESEDSIIDETGAGGRDDAFRTEE